MADDPSRQAFHWPHRLGPGSEVAGYRIEQQIGAGGMAIVFRARDQRLGRLVALKVLAPALAADEEFRARFIREWRAATAVEHPHIVPIYAADAADDILYIAMRMVNGGDLGQVVRRDGPLSPGRAAAFISAVGSALDAAHSVGLLHRDVKPGNILVDSAAGMPDHAYLSDFGLSKGASSSAALTGAGQFVGTAHYAAPEQISGERVDARADQYALACVAYELLTGGVPFERDHWQSVLLAHLSHHPPAVTPQRPDLPAPVDYVIAKGMAKSPGDRYQSCGEFAASLRAVLVRPARAGGTGYGAAPGFGAAPIPAPDRAARREQQGGVATDQRLREQAAATVTPAGLRSAGGLGATDGGAPGPGPRGGWARSRLSWLISAVVIVVVATIAATGYLTEDGNSATAQQGNGTGVGSSAGGNGSARAPVTRRSPGDLDEQIVVQSVVGLPVAKASQILRNEGFRVRPVKLEPVDPDGGYPGDVVRQSPAAPAALLDGSTVTIYFQAG
jgi:Protein kinase domain/PASTA domain